MTFKFDPSKRHDLIALITEIAQMYDPERIILFGSQARGDFSPDSDFDFVLVDCHAPTKLAHVYRLKSPLIFDCLKATTEQLNKFKSSANHVLAMAQREGVEIYNREFKLLI